MNARLTVGLFLDPSNLQSGLQKARSTVGTFASGVGNVASAPFRLLGGIGSGVMRGLGGIGLAADGVETLIGTVRGVGDALGVGLASDLEMARAQLIAFTKDVHVADQLLDTFQREADTTPFEFDEMAKSGAMLLPMTKAMGLNLMDVVREGEILAALNPSEGLTGAAFA